MKRFLTRARARGWSEALRAERDRLSSWWSSSDVLIVLSRPADADFTPQPDLQFRPCSPDDAEKYARDIGTDTRETFAHRLTHHTDCFVVESNGRFVHASWAARERVFVGEIGKYFLPPRGSAYVYESYTRPEARGKGIYPYALSGIASELSSGGVEELWIAVEASNTASRRSISKASFEIRFEVPFSRRFGRLTVDLSEVTMPAGGEISDDPPRLAGSSNPSSNL